MSASPKGERKTASPKGERLAKNTNGPDGMKKQKAKREKENARD